MYLVFECHMKMLALVRELCLLDMTNLLSDKLQAHIYTGFRLILHLQQLFAVFCYHVYDFFY